MTDINKQFFELIRIAIGNQVCLSHTPSADEWGELYAMAKKQSLVGVCFAGVQKLVSQKQAPPEWLYLQWMGMAAKIQQRNELLDRRNAHLQMTLDIEGLSSITIKGQAISTYYPLNMQHLRQSGDIDVWVLHDRRKVIEYVNKISPTNVRNLKHIELRCFKDVEVELHFIPAVLHCPWHNQKLQAFFSENSKCFEVEFINDGRVKMGSPNFNVIQLLAHSYHHLFGDGIGMRQIMDLYYAILTLPPDSRNFKPILCNCGLFKFAQSMMYILNVVFALPKDQMICSQNTRTGKFLLCEIMQSGNFGKYDERIVRGINESHLHRFLRVTKQNIKLIRISPWEVFWTPLWRIWHFFWMKQNGYVQ